MKTSFIKLSGGLAGLIALAVALIAVNVIVAKLAIRADLTEEKLYTLSEGSKKAVSSLQTPVTVKYFFSRNLGDVDVFTKTYATQVENLLKEYTEAADGKIILEINDPEPDSDEEEWAMQYGIEPQRVSMESPPMYFGLAVVSADGETEIAIPALSPRTESTLEYDITRAITRTANPVKPVIGVMSPLPVLGGPADPMNTMRGRGSRAWYALAELGRDAELRAIPMDATEINADVRELILIHPKNLTEKTQFAVDQFLLRGGRLMIFADPFSVADAITANQSGMNAMRQSFSSSPEKLFAAWGVNFNAGQIAADMKYQTRLQGMNGPEENMAFLSLDKTAFSDDVLVSQWGGIIMPFAGSFEFTETNSLKVTPLITLTEDSGSVSSMSVQMGSEAMRTQFKSGGKKLVLAARLSGTFKTAFPDGAPVNEDEEKSASGNALKSGESAVLLFADSDMLQDEVCVRINSMLGMSIPTILSDNINLFASAAEQLAGDSALLSVRARGRTLRPFTVVDNLEQKARMEYLDRENALVEKLRETQARLDDLQSRKSSNQRTILSEEQRAEITSFRDEQRKVSHELKIVRRNLNKDIEALGRRIKFINILAVPLIVTVFGIAGGIRRKRI